MLASLRDCRFPAEIVLLLALCIFLPLVEAPKNLAWLSYVLLWLANRLRTRDFGGRWDGWDTLFAAWIASGYLAAAFAGLHHNEWRGTGDLVRYASIGWLMKRGGYSDKELGWVLAALVASTVAGLAFGYWRLWSGAAKSGTLQLYSVGHVNHTAIYIAIMLGLCASWIFARWRAWRPRYRAFALAIGVLVLVALMKTASRGAIGVGLAMLMVIGAAWWPRWRLALPASAVAVCLTLAASIEFKVEVVQKQEQQVAAGNVLSYRDGIWNMALVTWQRYPWFGVGMDNYSRINHELVRQWHDELGKPYEKSRFIQFPHAHNLYVNTLAERGIVGFGILAAVLTTWFAWLVRKWPPPSGDDFDWLCWGAATGAWIATVAIGTVNTTLHHEHGILAMLLLGLWLSRLQQRRAS